MNLMLIDDLYDQLGEDYIKYDSRIAIKRRNTEKPKPAAESKAVTKETEKTNGTFSTTKISISGPTAKKSTGRPKRRDPSPLEKILDRLQGGRDNIKRLRVVRDKKEKFRKVNKKK